MGSRGHARQQFFSRIRTDDGRRYFGAIAPSEEHGRLLVMHAEGTESFTIDNIVAIRPIESTLRDRLETSVELGFSDYKASDTPELNLITTVQLYPGITESGRIRSDADITLQWEIIEDLNFNITAFGNFDNQSNEDGDDYDYGITTGIEWEL